MIWASRRQLGNGAMIILGTQVNVVLGLTCIAAEEAVLCSCAHFKSATIIRAELDNPFRVPKFFSTLGTAFRIWDFFFHPLIHHLVHEDETQI